MQCSESSLENWSSNGMLPDLRIVCCGDIMLGAEVGEYIGSTTVGQWLSDVSPVWKTADLLIGNLECPCIVNAKPVVSELPELIFHAPGSRLVELAEAGFSAVTIANNHILNCGPKGLFETLRGLDEAGIHHAGAGMNLAAALEPAFIPVGSAVVGLVAFCYGPEAGRSTPGVAPCDPRLMKRSLDAARARADVVVAALHDGLEYSDVPPTQTRRRFRFLAENGADIVVGHHPHVLQGIEWCAGVPIAYSLGDLLFHNSLPHVAERNFSRIALGRFATEETRKDPNKFSRGAVLEIQISGNKKSIQWHPFRQSPDLRPRLLQKDAKAQEVQRLADLSDALLNQSDPRHVLADKVSEAAWWESRKTLSTKQVLKLAIKPKWRYGAYGLRWVWKRLMNSNSRHKGIC